MGKRLIIQNSFPRGGTKYTDPDGEEYFKGIFWTRIINETNNPFELTIDFSGGSHEVPGKCDGTTRAGFSLKGQNLFYTVNGKEIHCGSINLKNLMLKK